MTKREFERKAGILCVSIGGTEVAGSAKIYSTGSVGWNLNGKVTITLPSGEEVRCQVTGNVIAVGSKEWKP